MTLTPFERFKLAVLSTDEISDKEVEKLFYDLEVGSEEDVEDVMRILRVHRPAVLKSISAKYIVAK